MKKLILILALALGAFLIYKYAFQEKDEKKEKPKAITVSKHSAAFNQSVQNVLDDYFAMTDAFVNWDADAVNKSAINLQQHIDSLKTDELKKDSIIHQTALFPLENSKGSIASIINANNWDVKRTALRDLSENLRMLLITIKYDQGILYWQECPMAFGEGQIGNWLSDKEEVLNPYLGKSHPKYGATMLNCGETKAKIDFASADTAM